MRLVNNDELKKIVRILLVVSVSALIRWWHINARKLLSRKLTKIDSMICVHAKWRHILWVDFTSTVQLLLTIIIYVSRHTNLCLNADFQLQKSNRNWVATMLIVYWITPGTRWHIQTNGKLYGRKVNQIANLAINHTYAPTTMSTNPPYLRLITLELSPRTYSILQTNNKTSIICHLHMCSEHDGLFTPLTFGLLKSPEKKVPLSRSSLHFGYKTLKWLSNMCYFQFHLFILWFCFVFGMVFGFHFPRAKKLELCQKEYNMCRHSI